MTNTVVPVAPVTEITNATRRESLPKSSEKLLFENEYAFQITSLTRGALSFR